ncbi:hypothetical protein HYY72_01930, partial [Candidatus Woesearchaeota archaeon]|nr:hypothetical protein [Candidatus Woesearchaeota archaeon]
MVYFNYKKQNVFGGLWLGSSKSKPSCPKTIRDQLRVKWWKGKYEGSCFCCGRKLSYEHVEAGRIKAGGKYTIPNTRLICKTCNRGMGKTNLKVYVKRNYPERYEKYFDEDVKKETKKKSPIKKPKDDTIFGRKVFG